MITHRETPSREQYQRTLGQVLLALRGHDVFAGMTDLDYWRTLEGHLDIDWRGGAFPREVVAALFEGAADSEFGELQADELHPTTEPGTVWLNGVRVRFRSDAPVGAAEGLRQAITPR